MECQQLRLIIIIIIKIIIILIIIAQVHDHLAFLVRSNDCDDVSSACIGNAKLKLFADDIKLYSSFNVDVSNCGDIRQSLDLLPSWASDIRQSLDPLPLWARDIRQSLDLLP